MGRRTNVSSVASGNAPLLDRIEPRVRALVDALNRTGLVETFTSCEGHYGYRRRRGDFTYREQANVGFFLEPRVPERELVRFFGRVLADYHLRGTTDAVFEVAKRYIASLDGADAPELYFEFTVRPFDPHASNVAKRSSTDKALAVITRSVTCVAPWSADRLEEPSRDEIQAALTSHGLWRTRFAAAVAAGAAPSGFASAAQDDHCEIGKWLHRTRELKARPGFENVIMLHAGFHREASQALQLALAGKKRQARKLVGARSTFARTSSDLIRAVQSWAA